MSFYYLLIDASSRMILRRSRGFQVVSPIAGARWCKVDRSAWKRYRAGDVVNFADLGIDDNLRLVAAAVRAGE